MVSSQDSKQAKIRVPVCILYRWMALTVNPYSCGAAGLFTRFEEGIRTYPPYQNLRSPVVTSGPYKSGGDGLIWLFCWSRRSQWPRYGSLRLSPPSIMTKSYISFC